MLLYLGMFKLIISMFNVIVCVFRDPGLHVPGVGLQLGYALPRCCP